MERSELALLRARGAYARAHIASGLRGVVLAGALVMVAIALHRTTQATWFVASVLAATLATLGWRGGAWRRGALAGVAVGIPVFVAPALYLLTTHGHCAQCAAAPSLTCMLTCITTSTLAGTIVGYAATRDESPRRFGGAAISTALLAGLLGCGTVGFVGALGVMFGLAGGGVTGWVFAGRTARA